MLTLWSKLVSQINDHLPATKKDIRHIMATLADIQASLAAAKTSDDSVVALVNSLKQQVATQTQQIADLQALISTGANGASTTDLDAVKQAIDAITNANQAALS
jgi:chromosome segregation ATPase